MPIQSPRVLVSSLCLLSGAMLAIGLVVGLAPQRAGGELLAWSALAVGLGVVLAAVLRRCALTCLGTIMALQDAEHEAEKLRFATAIDNMSQGLCFFDGQQRLIVCNDRYADMYRLSRQQVRRGTTLREIVDHRYQVGCMPDMSREAYLAWRDSIAIAEKPSRTVSTLKDGRTIAIHHRPMPGGGWVATHDDITEHRAALEEIEHMARHDALTSLPNRVLFRDRLSTAMRENRHPTAVLCLDLDRFKPVNDTLGHPAGDELLRLAAQRLTACVREGDLVARLGGDEFAIIQLGGGQPAAAEALAGRLVHAIAQPFDLAGQQVSIGTSVGIVLSSDECDDPDDLLKRADLALYDAKAHGRGTHTFFRPELDRRVRGRRELEVDLRHAVDNGGLAVHFQPLIALPGEQVVAFEALVRWPHPRRGMVTPDDFIPLAEEIGLIDRVGEWVLREACACAVRWPREVDLAVNLSPLQLKSGHLVDVVHAALRDSGLAPSRLELEITESVPLVDNSISLATLHGLRALGVRISIDDFGAGFSSVSYLRRFPFDKIKIDRSFVRDVGSDRSAQAIVHAMATLGRSLGIEVTAEGVETAEQLQRVRELGCSQAQGYLISTPQPASELPAILRRNVRLATA